MRGGKPTALHNSLLVGRSTNKQAWCIRGLLVPYLRVRTALARMNAESFVHLVYSEQEIQPSTGSFTE